MTNQSIHLPQWSAGFITLSLRWVIGWTYFSAFWRRVVLENKLNPEEAGYIGEKFNHFLPNALGIKPIIEYLVTHPQALERAMITFTIVEAIVGAFIILGLFTRLMSLGVFSLALGILLGSGWLGTTCLDEWQIGVLGIASGFVLFLSGSDRYSLDYYFMKKQFRFTKTKTFQWLGSGAFPMINPGKMILGFSIFIFGLTLFTNQYFHGGVYGKLHNKSVKPDIAITQAKLQHRQLQFTVFRTEGADVYGSFLIGIQLLNKMGEPVVALSGSDLATFPLSQIKNDYVAKVKPGKHSMIIPLGAKATITLPISEEVKELEKITTLKLIDISGIEWSTALIH